MAHSHAHIREIHQGQKKAHEFVKGLKRGGRAHSDEAEDKKLFGKMIKKHDAEHKAEGKKSGGRLDKFARGGRAKGKHGNKTNVNIVVAPHGPHPAAGAAPPAPGGLPPPGAGPMPPPGGPMGGPPLGGPPGGIPGGPPPGMPPGMGPKPPGMMKRGGAVKKYARGGPTNVPPKMVKIGAKMKAGSDTGTGRLDQARIQKADR